MSAKLSRTLAGISFLEFFLLPFVFGPFLGQRPCAGPAPEDTAPLLDERCSDGLEENALGGRLNNRFSAVLNLELLAQPCRNDDLAFRSKPSGIYSCCRAHEQ